MQVFDAYPGTTKQGKWVWLGYTTAIEVWSSLPGLLQESASQRSLCNARAVLGGVIGKAPLGAGSLKKVTKSLTYAAAACTLIPPKAPALSLTWKRLCVNTLYNTWVKWKGCVSCSSPWGVRLQVLRAFPSIPCRLPPFHEILGCFCVSSELWQRKLADSVCLFEAKISEILQNS